MSWVRVSLICAAGILFQALWYGPALKSSTALGRNDFLNFYTAGKLAGTNDLYVPARFIAAEAANTGYSTSNLIFVRLPWQAGIFSLLARLQYFSAYCIWQLLGFAALASAILVWKSEALPTKLVACAWSFPLFTSFAVGQDLAFVVLAIACAFRLEGKSSVLSGACLAICVAKVHLLWLFLLIFLGSRIIETRRQVAGFMGAGCVLLALSYVAGGRTWFQELVQALRFCETHENLALMPNLHRLWISAPAMEFAGALAVVLVVVGISRRSRNLGCAAALAGGLLIGRHCFLADCSLLLPAAGLFSAAVPRWRPVSLPLLIPLSYLPTFLGNPLVTTAMMAGFVMCCYAVSMPLSIPLRLEPAVSR